MRAFVLSALGVCAAAATVSPVAAQSTPAPDTALAARLQAVARVRVGHDVRVRLTNGATLAGRFAGARGDVLALRLPPPTLLPPAVLADTMPYELAVAEVDSLWERRRLGPAVPFVAAGAGALLGFAAVFDAESTDEGDCDSECWRASGTGAALGALVGFAAGLVVALIVSVWDQRFP